MTPEEISIETRKFWLTVASIFIAIVSLSVTFCSYNASVSRTKVDRTLDLITLADEPHIEAARTQFQSYLLLLGRANLRVDKTLTGDQQQQRKTEIYTDTLNRYQTKRADSGIGNAWSMIRPLGDYYLRVLGCLDADACDKTIYCELIADEINVFSRVTRDFRNKAQTQKVYAERLDKVEKSNRCG